MCINHYEGKAMKKEELPNEETAKIRYNFQKALNRFVETYKKKGLKIKSVKIEWG